MAINKVIVNGETKLDLTADTVTVDDVKQGVTFHDASGVLKTGLAVNSGGIEGLYFKDYGIAESYAPGKVYPTLNFSNSNVSSGYWGIIKLNGDYINSVYIENNLNYPIEFSTYNRIIGFSTSEDGVNNIVIEAEESGC